MKEFYTISDLAKEFDVTTRTIRFYEDQNLISPLREGTRRLFRARDRTRLKLILRGKRLGFTLAEISEIVDMYDAAPGEVGQLRLLISKIEGRRAQLQQQMQDIEATLSDLSEVEKPLPRSAIGFGRRVMTKPLKSAIPTTKRG